MRYFSMFSGIGGFEKAIQDISRRLKNNGVINYQEGASPRAFQFTGHKTKAGTP